MKTMICALMLFALVGCASKQQGAASGAATVTAGALSVMGVHDGYAAANNSFLDLFGWNDTPKTTLSGENSTQP